MLEINNRLLTYCQKVKCCVFACVCVCVCERERELREYLCVWTSEREKLFSYFQCNKLRVRWTNILFSPLPDHPSIKVHKIKFL